MDEHGGSLIVHRRRETWTHGEGDARATEPITALEISGDVEVPFSNCPVILTVRVVDVTDGDKPGEWHPVFCRIDPLSDENGHLLLTEELTIPYTSTTLKDYPGPPIPDFALVLPRRGRRRLMALVMVARRDEPDADLAAGLVRYDMDFGEVGYLEWEAHTVAQEENLLRIFVAASTIDGTVGQAEFDEIKRFLADRYARHDDATSWKSRATATLKRTAAEIDSGSTTPERLLNSTARAIVEAGDAESARAAYEIAVRAVAADGVIGPKEEKLLTRLALALALDDGAVRELRERFIRSDMYADASDKSLLGMPAGMTLEAKRAWLSAEYAKWRGRVSHADPLIAAEATTRLERIARLRSSLV
jgi:tellurite resistance protein